MKQQPLCKGRDCTDQCAICLKGAGPAMLHDICLQAGQPTMQISVQPSTAGLPALFVA